MNYFNVGIIILFVALSACNITYKVRNQDNEIDEVIYFPCGKLTVELAGRGNSKFEFNQKFELDAPITFFMDSLKFFFNGKEIDAKFNSNDRKEINEPISISGIEQLKASFEFDKGVFQGDTIKVWGPGIILCKDKEVTLDTLVYTFINNLRIYGVNQ